MLRCRILYSIIQDGKIEIDVLLRECADVWYVINVQTKNAIDILDKMSVLNI